MWVHQAPVSNMKRVFSSAVPLYCIVCAWNGDMFEQAAVTRGQTPARKTERVTWVKDRWESHRTLWCSYSFLSLGNEPLNRSSMKCYTWIKCWCRYSDDVLLSALNAHLTSLNVQVTLRLHTMGQYSIGCFWLNYESDQDTHSLLFLYLCLCTLSIFVSTLLSVLNSNV